MKFIVRTWYGESETTYNFGPFESEETAEDFLVNKLGDKGIIEVLNNPELAGTGQEMS